MTKNQTIQLAARLVKKKLSVEASGHDWWHTYRVWKLAVAIGKQEKADLFIIELAALLHDVADWKFSAQDNNIIANFIRKLKIDQEKAEKIISIINTISFKGIARQTTPKTLEGKIVQDADRLDALGAIGIARTFTTGAVRGRVLYDPLVPIGKRVKDFGKCDSYSSVHHFYDKVLLLKKLMNTKTGKRLAVARHKIVVAYLKEFFAEWEGKA